MIRSPVDSTFNGDRSRTDEPTQIADNLAVTWDRARIGRITDQLVTWQINDLLIRSVNDCRFYDDTVSQLSPSLCKMNIASTLNRQEDTCKDLNRETYVRAISRSQRIIANYRRCIDLLPHSTGSTLVQSSRWLALSYRENFTEIRGSRKNSSWVESAKSQWFRLRSVRRSSGSLCEFRGGLDDPRWRPTRERLIWWQAITNVRNFCYFSPFFFYFSFFFLFSIEELEITTAKIVPRGISLERDAIKN